MEGTPLSIYVRDQRDSRGSERLHHTQARAHAKRAEDREERWHPARRARLASGIATTVRTVRHHRGEGQSALSRVSVCRVEAGTQAGMIIRLPQTVPFSNVRVNTPH